DEGAGYQVAGLVIHCFFEQCLRDPLHQSTVHLPVDEQRIDDGADIVHTHIFADLDGAGIGIDLHGGQVCAVREREVLRVECGVAVQTGLEPVGQIMGGENGQ